MARNSFNIGNNVDKSDEYEKLEKNINSNKRLLNSLETQLCKIYSEF